MGRHCLTKAAKFEGAHGRTSYEFSYPLSFSAEAYQVFYVVFQAAEF
jgi:hypothetical protein